MTTVSSYNSWDPLEEVILGVADGASIPDEEPAWKAKAKTDFRENNRYYYECDCKRTLQSQITDIITTQKYE